MKKIGEIVRYACRIPVGFLRLPSILNRLQNLENQNIDLQNRCSAQEQNFNARLQEMTATFDAAIREMKQDLNHSNSVSEQKWNEMAQRMDSIEADIRSMRSKMEPTLADLAQRMQTVEEDIRINHPDLRRRMQLVEDEIRVVHPDLQRRMQTVEDEMRVVHPDLQRRIQTVEDEMRNLHPQMKQVLTDLSQRMQTVEEDVRINHPDLRRRMQIVEDEMHAVHPDLQRRMQVVEDNIRTKLLHEPMYREVSAKKLPVSCSCRHILGKEITSTEKPRILVDVSQLLIVNGRSGIQRVVIRVLDAMLEDTRCLYVPVGLYTGKMHYVEYHQEEGAFYIGDPLSVMAKDTLLMLDSSWEFCEFFDEPFAQVQAAGGHIYFIVHDLIPLLQPQYVTEVMAGVFGTWLVDSVGHADGMMCASKTVAGQLRDYILKNHLQHQADPLKIGHFVEGADFIEASDDAELDPKLSGIFERVKGKRKFLSVSTLEPRKNHSFMLDVMDQLWKRGYDVVYFIVGRQGWNAEDLVERISNHPELDKRLFWFNFLEDKELQQVYQESDILLNLSHGEGFGLSLVEGAHYQCSVIASDIPVFREVITDDTTLFCDIDSLDETVAAIAAKLDKDSFVPSAAKYYKWSDALSSMLQCMQKSQWDFSVKK